MAPHAALAQLVEHVVSGVDLIALFSQQSSGFLDYAIALDIGFIAIT